MLDDLLALDGEVAASVDGINRQRATQRKDARRAFNLDQTDAAVPPLLQRFATLRSVDMLPLGRLLLRAADGATPQDAPREPAKPSSILGSTLFAPLAAVAPLGAGVGVVGAGMAAAGGVAMGAAAAPTLAQGGAWVAEQFERGFASVPSKAEIDTLNARSRQAMADRFGKCVAANTEHVAAFTKERLDRASKSRVYETRALQKNRAALASVDPHY